MEYNEYPDILELDRYKVIERYKGIDDYVELYNVVQKDLIKLRNNLTGIADSIYEMENLVKNFSWWLFFSDGLTTPATLDDDNMGRSFMPYFREIKANLININNG